MNFQKRYKNTSFMLFNEDDVLVFKSYTHQFRIQFSSTMDASVEIKGRVKIEVITSKKRRGTI